MFCPFLFVGRYQTRISSERSHYRRVVYSVYRYRECVGAGRSAKSQNKVDQSKNHRGVASREKKRRTGLRRRPVGTMPERRIDKIPNFAITRTFITVSEIRISVNRIAQNARRLRPSWRSNGTHTADVIYNVIRRRRVLQTTHS